VVPDGCASEEPHPGRRMRFLRNSTNATVDSVDKVVFVELPTSV
jgi:hypothetical protein